MLIIIVEGGLLLVVLLQDGESSAGDFAFFASYITAVVLPVLAIMLVTSEWTQRTAMVTFALEPRRGRVLLAKYITGVVLTLVAVLVAVVVGLACALVCQVVQPDLTSFDLGGRFLGGFVITQVLAMSLGFALACLLLNTPAAIVVFVAYRVIPVSVFGVLAVNLETFAKVRPWIDFEYAQGPLYDLSVSGAEWGHLLTAGALWLGLPLALGVLRILRAEVK
ncbi:ABC-2 transporter permease [Nocardioides sp.]|uniref:ABC-2 transporter permease n=1 Tax=Nocardioides sp. TaxID=35761 RepID=UPI002B2786A6|nr:ABC-2 transporter permease [Nocardioides sp.]